MTTASTSVRARQPRSWKTWLRNAAAILVVISLVIGISYGIYSTRSANARTADFSITASSPVPTGTGETSTVLVRSLDGFNGQVSIRATPPNGVFCTGVPGTSSSATIFVPGSWTLQCKASTAGTYPVTVSATAAGVSRNATVWFRFGDVQRNTIMAFACNPTMVTINQTTSCQVSITDSSPGAKISPTGTINLVAADSPELVISTCTLVHETCSLNYTSANIGTVHLVANYNGDGVHSSKQVSTIVVIRSMGTITSLNCVPSTLTVHGPPATCNVTVTGTGADQESIPSGSVIFATGLGGTVTPSTCILTEGNCSVQYASLSGVGSFVLTANYTGDQTHASSIGQTTISVALAESSTSLTCDPSTILVNSTPSKCTVTVNDGSVNPSSPTGFVQARCSTACTIIPATNMCSLTANSPSSSTCNFNVTSANPTTVMSVFANYQGDPVHMPSSGQFVVTVTSAPQYVTVSGHATTTDQCFRCQAVRLDFVNRNTGLVYTATVNSSTYTIKLANMQSYNVIMYWTGLMGTSGTCTGAVLNLHQSTDTLTVDVRC